MAEFDDLLEGLFEEPDATNSRSGGAVDSAINDCVRATHIATKRYEQTPCREHAVIAMEAACRWFDLLRKLNRPLDEPMPLVKRFAELIDRLEPSEDPELKLLALAHALYASTESLSQYPWDCREPAERQKYVDVAKAALTYLGEHNGMTLGPPRTH